MRRVLHSVVFFLLIVFVGASDHLVYSHFVNAASTEQRTEEDDNRGAEEVRINNSDVKLLKAANNAFSSRIICIPLFLKIESYQSAVIAYSIYLALRVIRI